MELEEQLTDFAERIQSGCGPYVGYDEVQQWPKGRLEELLGMGVLIKTTSATMINCNECSNMDCPPIEPSIETFPGASEPEGAFLCKKEGGGGLIRIPLKKMNRWEIVVERLIELGYMDVDVEEQNANYEPPTLEQDSFQKKGTLWEVVYNGKLGNYRDLKGMGYIARLLAKPNEYISAFDLAQSVASAGNRKKESTSETETETSINNQSVQEMVDETGLKECYKRLKEIPGEIERAKDTGDLAKQEDLAKERISILKYVKQSTFGTSTKTFDGDVGKARKAVGKAINTAIGKFETDNPELFRHLSSAIQQGMQCMYAPETPQNWVF